MDFKEFRSKLKIVNIEALKLLAVDQNKKHLVQLNRDQLRAGLRIDGAEIIPKYSHLYGFFKQRQATFKAPPFVPDLFDTGRFQGAMFLKLTPKDFFITSKDSKTVDLTGRYKGIFGLTTASELQARTLVQRSFNKLFRNKTGL
jgi:hypothetical protein